MKLAFVKWLNDHPTTGCRNNQMAQFPTSSKPGYSEPWRMVDQNLKREPAASEQATEEVVDNGGTRSGQDRRQPSESYSGEERRSGRDRRRGYDRRTGLPRRRMPERRTENRYYWKGIAVERRDAFRKG
jgi:hypothetical protein